MILASSRTVGNGIFQPATLNSWNAEQDIAPNDRQAPQPQLQRQLNRRSSVDMSVLQIFIYEEAICTYFVRLSLSGLHRLRRLVLATVLLGTDHRRCQNSSGGPGGR